MSANDILFANIREILAILHMNVYKKAFHFAVKYNDRIVKKITIKERLSS